MTDETSQAVLDDFQAAWERYESLQEELSPIAIETVERLDDHRVTLDRLFDAYEDRATGSGDFGGYITFQQNVTQLVSSLPDDLPEREAFEEVNEIANKRRLSKADFEAARRALDPVRDIIDIRNDLANAREDLHEHRIALKERISELDEQIEEVDRVIELGQVDIHQPLDDIRDPIDRYNDAVADDFHSYLAETPVQDVFAFIEKSGAFPLVHVPKPPESLKAYIQSTELGLTLYELREYADYSRSKLSHYIDDPGRFKAEVATEQTYLASINADPFRIDWPPPPAAELRWLMKELLPVVARFASESTVSALRQVRDACIHPEHYSTLRAVAVARHELTDEQREQLAAGSVEPQRQAYLTAKERIQRTLKEAPDV